MRELRQCIVVCRVTAPLRGVGGDDPLSQPCAQRREGSLVGGGAAAAPSGGNAPDIPGRAAAQVPAGVAGHVQSSTHG